MITILGIKLKPFIKTIVMNHGSNYKPKIIITEGEESLTNPIRVSFPPLKSFFLSFFPLFSVMSTPFISYPGGHVLDCIGGSWRSLGGDLYNT